MKTREIKIEPGSGTLLAGKKVVLKGYANDKTAVKEIIYVGEEFFHSLETNGESCDCYINNGGEWLEVLPDDPPVHDEFFKKIGKLQLRFFVDQNDPCFFYHTAEEVYQNIESRILAKLKSEGVVK